MWKICLSICLHQFLVSFPCFFFSLCICSDSCSAWDTVHIWTRAQVNCEDSCKNLQETLSLRVVKKNCKISFYNVDTKLYGINILSSLSQSKLSAINTGPPKRYVFLHPPLKLFLQRACRSHVYIEGNIRARPHTQTHARAHTHISTLHIHQLPYAECIIYVMK